MALRAQVKSWCITAVDDTGDVFLCEHFPTVPAPPGASDRSEVIRYSEKPDHSFKLSAPELEHLRAVLASISMLERS